MKFVKGKFLSEQYYKRHIQKLIAKAYPRLNYSAGLIGPGSDVLGFDTIRSTDHDWGPRLMIFLKEKDFYQKQKIKDYLKQHLPKTFMGYPTHFRGTVDGDVKVMAKLKKGETFNPGIAINTVEKFFAEYMGIQNTNNIKITKWLLLSEHKLRTIKEGRLFRDDLSMNILKAKFDYYPNDIWLYLMAAEWQKIAQEEPFMARCGEVGDELGSRLIAYKLVRSIMNLVFQMERQYIPYSKWFGTAFNRLNKAKIIKPILDKVLVARKWQSREAQLSKAYKTLGKFHNELKITEFVSPELSYFFNRPYQIIDADRYVEALREKIKSPDILNIKANIGSVNQITQTVDVLEQNDLIQQMKYLFK